MAHDMCWDPHGQAIIGRAVKAGFGVTEVEDELKPSWGASRFDSRNSGAPWLPSGSARPPAPAARILQRTETEEELRRINNRRELYEAKKQLHEQEVQDAARTNNYTEVREHDRVASVRVPKAPAAPPNVLAVLRDVLPLPAVRQAQQLATHPGACLEEHVAQSGSLVAAARQAQKARLTPHSGQNENQAMVGQSEVATRKMESSTAE